MYTASRVRIVELSVLIESTNHIPSLAFLSARIIRTSIPIYQAGSSGITFPSAHIPAITFNGNYCFTIAGFNDPYMVSYAITFPVKDNEIAGMRDIISASPPMLLLIKVYPATDNSRLRANTGLDAAALRCNI